MLQRFLTGLRRIEKPPAPKQRTSVLFPDELPREPREDARQRIGQWPIKSTFESALKKFFATPIIGWAFEGTHPTTNSPFEINLTCFDPENNPQVHASLVSETGGNQTRWSLSSNPKALQLETSTAGRKILNRRRLNQEEIVALRRFLRDFLGREKHFPIKFDHSIEEKRARALALQQKAKLQILQWLRSIE